jgi:hypothetical protein
MIRGVVTCIDIQIEICTSPSEEWIEVTVEIAKV